MNKPLSLLLLLLLPACTVGPMKPPSNETVICYAQGKPQVYKSRTQKVTIGRYWVHIIDRKGRHHWLTQFPCHIMEGK